MLTDGTPPCPDYTQRFAEYYRRVGFPCQIAEGILWVEENRMLFAIVPASQSSVVSEQTARQLLANSRRAVLVKTTDGLPQGLTANPWYAVICRRHLRLEDCPAKTRSEIRRGLRENQVRPIDAEYYADHGYDLHVAAYARYGKPPKTKERFREAVLVARDFTDVIDFWGVFYENRLVGCAENHRYGRTEVAYSAMAFHPEYFKFYTAYALLHQMSAYYLEERRVDYANDGFRTVLHATGLQQLLIRKFGFEPAYTHLHLHYHPGVACIMSLPTPVRHLLGRASSRFAALNALHEASQSQC
jgi:hypothetical protein